MLSRRMVLAGLLIGLAWSMSAESVFGQRLVGPYVTGQRPIQNNQAMMPQQVTVNGAITLMSSGNLVVTDKGNRTWKVSVSRDTTVHVTGTATADYLRSPHAAMTVDFKAEFDDHGTVKEKISEMTITAPSTEQGVFPEGGAAPAADADTGKADAGKAAKHGSAGGKSLNKSVKGVPPAGSYHVVGRLNYAHGKFIVEAHGAHHFEIEVADDANIKVDTTETNLSTVGDNITVSGMTPPPKMVMGRPVSAPAALIEATDVKITLAEPLTGPKKKPAPAKAASHPKKDKDKDDGATNDGVPPLGP